MSATITYLDDRGSDEFFQQDMLAIREWERFKWLAQGLRQAQDAYTVAQLDALLAEAPEMPGQHEKVVVMLALKASPQALAVLEAIDTRRCDPSFRALHSIAIRYAKSRLA